MSLEVEKRLKKNNLLPKIFETTPDKELQLFDEPAKRKKLSEVGSVLALGEDEITELAFFPGWTQQDPPYGCYKQGAPRLRIEIVLR